MASCDDDILDEEQEAAYTLSRHGVHIGRLKIKKNK
jgi:hypothetical protein